MMPIGKRRKSCAMEKVENIFRTATAEKFLLTRATKKFTLARSASCVRWRGCDRVLRGGESKRKPQARP
jgi:hypothetical protein